MIAAALARVPVDWHFHLIYVALAGAAFIGGVGLALNFKTVTVTRTVHDSPRVVAGSAAQVAAAWGRPDQTIPGPQVNRSLPPAITCYLWQSKHAMLCY